MSDEEHKTLTLSEFAERALQGEIIEQEMVGGPKAAPQRVAIHVHTPRQDDLLKAQGLMVRIANVASKATRETDITEDDATLAYELGLTVLAACVRTATGERLPDAGIVHLFGGLPYKSEVMTRCQELCGVTMISVPPLDNAAAIEAVGAEAAELAAAVDDAKPNRKERRKAAKTAKTRSSSEDNPALRSNQR